MKYKVLPQNAPKLVLNFGHSPLYRHFCKCLYIGFDKYPSEKYLKRGLLYPF